MLIKDLKDQKDTVLLDTKLFHYFYENKNIITFSEKENEILCFAKNKLFLDFKNKFVNQIIVEKEFFEEKEILINNFQKWLEQKFFEENVPIKIILDFILINCIEQNISDVHFDCFDNFKYVVKFKKDTVLKEFICLTKQQADSLIIILKIISSCDISVKNKPQTASFQKIYKLENVDFRFSTHPTFFGERFVLRVLQKKNVVEVEKIVVNNDVLDCVKKIIKSPSGFCVFTGPTNSGKTTLIHSILKEIAKQGVSVMTLEDPVEYKVPGIVQTSVSDAGLTYLEGMKSLLRQDPSVIFIGEIRDQKTGLIACEMAMLGHKVLTTLHAFSTEGALVRLVDFGVSLRVLSQCLLSLFSQRLLRKFDFEKKEYNGVLTLIDFVYFDENLKDQLKQNIIPSLKNNLLEMASELVQQKLTTEEEVARVVGI